MDVYTAMAKVPVFSVDDVDRYYNNIGSSRSAVKRLMAYHKVMKIRNNMYTCVSAQTGGPIANRFQIASSITETSYISHYSAMEYYGTADQVYYDVYVSSETKFNDFEFDGYTYHYIPSPFSEGVESPEFSGGIRITNRERTVADCLKDMDKIGGYEEVIADLSVMTSIDENKLLLVLKAYDNQFLYQKTGYLLWPLRDSLGLSSDFFDLCRSKIGKSKRYLSKDIKEGTYNNEWKLVIPSQTYAMKNGGLISDASI
ncbi:MAG: hypothetical protein IJ744_00020 [Lachnospiraceae bacterium]|nr:hypothetical protein [Lachnospiraceae bacterium]